MVIDEPLYKLIKTSWLTSNDYTWLLQFLIIDKQKNNDNMIISIKNIDISIFTINCPSLLSKQVWRLGLMWQQNCCMDVSSIIGLDDHKYLNYLKHGLSRKSICVKILGLVVSSVKSSADSYYWLCSCVGNIRNSWREAKNSARTGKLYIRTSW